MILLIPSQMTNELQNGAGPRTRIEPLSTCELKPGEKRPMVDQISANPRASALAVIGFLASALSFGGWVATRIPLPALGVAGVLLGLLALRAIRRKPARLEGRAVAWAGIAVGFLNLIAVIAFSVFVTTQQTYSTFG